MLLRGMLRGCGILRVNDGARRGGISGESSYFRLCLVRVLAGKGVELGDRDQGCLIWSNGRIEGVWTGVCRRADMPKQYGGGIRGDY